MATFTLQSSEYWWKGVPRYADLEEGREKDGKNAFSLHITMLGTNHELPLGHYKPSWPSMRGVFVMGTGKVR